MKTIDFGIDLGTTNSLIAKFSQGRAEVLKNPIGFRDTLPSCVAFRGERILVGDKAREWVLKDPLNVFSSFKRKMGTGEKYFVPATLESLSAIELSAYVLKELKNFIIEPAKPRSIVITIPASFDTVQSNATKQAGYEAGFEEVVLLQEPIAASLAFFNNRQQNENGKWLVYDLGGGTFDAAIIEVENGEMKVKDHQGNNFLGGIDLDHNMVVNLFVPKLVEISGHSDLAENITGRNGPYERLYYMLLLKAEECKKELSMQEISEVDFSFEIPGEKTIDVFFEIKRSEFEELAKPFVQSSMDMVQELFDRNGYGRDKIEEIVLIGGSTLIPLVRKMLTETFGIPLNYSADPATAVAVGAAYYAGTRMETLKIEAEENSNSESNKKYDVKILYNTSTRDREEYIRIIPPADMPLKYFRITRKDSGFDSGLKEIVNGDAGEFVTLREKNVNEFLVRFFDADHHELFCTNPYAEITQGLYSLYGQPLPEDICIEVDDLENNTTMCELIFERNSILPISKTIYKEISRNIKNQDGDSIIINVLEGDHTIHPNANKIIGVIEINGSKLNSQIIRGSEVEIKIEISESRDVHVQAIVLFTNQEFSEVFSPTEKYVSLNKLREEIVQLKSDFENSLYQNTENEDYEAASLLAEGISELDELERKLSRVKENDVTDVLYQAEEQKRRIAKKFFSTQSRSGRFQQELQDCIYLRHMIQDWCDSIEDVPGELKLKFDEIKSKEHDIVKTGSYFLIKNYGATLNRHAWKIIYKTPQLTVMYYHIYSAKDESEFTDKKRMRSCIERGEKALERQNYIELSSVLNELIGLSKSAQSEALIKGTGIG